MIARTTVQEDEAIAAYIEDSLRDRYPDIHVDRADVEYDGSKVYIRCDFDEHYHQGDGDNLWEEYYADDIGLYDGLLDEGAEIVQWAKHKLAEMVRERLEELNGE